MEEDRKKRKEREKENRDGGNEGTINCDKFLYDIKVYQNTEELNSLQLYHFIIFSPNTEASCSSFLRRYRCRPKQY